MSDDFRCCPSCGQIVLSPEQLAREQVRCAVDRLEMNKFSDACCEALARAYDSESKAETVMRRTNDDLLHMKGEA